MHDKCGLYSIHMQIMCEHSHAVHHFLYQSVLKNYGYIQETSSQALKPSIQNDPVVVEPYNKPKQFSGGAVGSITETL